MKMAQLSGSAVFAVIGAASMCPSSICMAMAHGTSFSARTAVAILQFHGLERRFRAVVRCLSCCGTLERTRSLSSRIRHLGNVADLQAIGKLCDDNGILWGLHDNCTDFYPDADDFSIKRTFFWQKDGAPAKGWYNKGRDAQAMWFRPDATLPFVHRNYTEMRKAIQPTHAFVDVLTSVSCIEYYDDEGHFHSSLDTRQAWRDIFNEICHGPSVRPKSLFRAADAFSDSFPKRTL